MRTFGLACLLALVLLIPAYGNVFVRASWNSGAQTVNGVVSIVQLSVVVTDNNVSTQVTVVTLANQRGSSTLSFCGDRRTQFPLNDFVQATFMPGQPCAELFSVVIKINSLAEGYPGDPRRTTVSACFRLPSVIMKRPWPNS